MFVLNTNVWCVFMSQITIQCRLVAQESDRQKLWTLMADLNTPFINELLKQVAQHPDFETWQQKGHVKAGIIEQLGNTLKTDARFISQPARFYSSAISLVKYIYKSWFKLQQRLQRKLEGKRRWLEMLRSDEELIEQCNCSLEALRSQAIELLTALTDNLDPQVNISTRLFESYRNTEDILRQSAIIFLLKNSGKVPQKEEEPQKFSKRRRKVEISIERLQEQIDASLPQGRDLTGNLWLETLLTACVTAPQDTQQTRHWQDILLTKTAIVPFPINYETNEDLTWSKNDKGRLCVHFSGLSEHIFEIYCDQHQLRWFQRFYEDQQIKKASKNQHSSALFTLRSARFLWIEDEGKGQPWNIHHLILQCTIDTRLWTAEGTEQVRQEKAEEIAQVLTRMNEKGDLNEKQQAFIKRKNSTLAKLDNPFPRPSKALYQGRSQILVGVAMGLEKPATVAVVDGTTGNVITYRSLKQLLGDRYPLLNRQRQQKQKLSHQRNVAQKHESFNRFGESELGQYIDRLLAKAIVEIAKTYQAGSIAVPKLKNIRESVQAEVQARAEQKIPNCLEAQAKYAKQYRVSVHQWSYGRLIESIQAQASKVGIVIEEGEQVIRGSPQHQAKELAINVYQARSVTYM